MVRSTLLEAKRVAVVDLLNEKSFAQARAHPLFVEQNSGSSIGLPGQTLMPLSSVIRLLRSRSTRRHVGSA